ncbi:MAG: nicotinate phosphoribosyltransferase [Sphaerospermopsis sp. SIO1G2]|nr:nicotinate phosphoribosyltransferase [Sphaerospermopsis sp. SIO1G1]NET70325.1 nicotinate phosphoribosyltransferase [Sphaerospermopsis sp. SIO1G2]
MMISKMFVNMIQFISEAFMRIFTPADDAYPVVGFQPFTGVPYKKRHAAYW